jgi:hypothetical protein
VPSAPGLPFGIGSAAALGRLGVGLLHAARAQV